MFEYIVTAFKVLVSIFTPERITLCACIVFGVFVLWILFSLLFSFQVKFSRCCRNISSLVDTYGLTSETYPKFIELGSKLPDSFLRGWKTFEHSSSGLPSEYLKRAECLDAELNGGLFNQNRSTMRSFITLFTILFGLIGLASLGSDSAITGYALAEILVVPFLFALISTLAYYLYTALRHHQYRVCVEDFNEMLDILNEKIENTEVEFANKNYLDSHFVKNIVEPKIEDAEKNLVFIDNEHNHEELLENKTDDNKYTFENFDPIEDFDEPHEIVDSIGDHQPVIDQVDNDEQLEEQKIEHVVGEVSKPIEKKVDMEYDNEQEMSQGDNKMEEITPATEVKRGRGRPKKEKKPEGELIIANDEEFEEVLARAEKLMKKNEEPLSTSQQKRVEKALKELVDAMKKYKGEM